MLAQHQPCSQLGHRRTRPGMRLGMRLALHQPCSQLGHRRTRPGMRLGTRLALHQPHSQAAGERGWQYTSLVPGLIPRLQGNKAGNTPASFLASFPGCRGTRLAIHQPRSQAAGERSLGMRLALSSTIPDFAMYSLLLFYGV